MKLSVIIVLFSLVQMMFCPQRHRGKSLPRGKCCDCTKSPLKDYLENPDKPSKPTDLKNYLKNPDKPSKPTDLKDYLENPDKPSKPTDLQNGWKHMPAPSGRYELHEYQKITPDPSGKTIETCTTDVCDDMDCSDIAPSEVVCCIGTNGAAYSTPGSSSSSISTHPIPHSNDRLHADMCEDAVESFALYQSGDTTLPLQFFVNDVEDQVEHVMNANEGCTPICNSICNTAMRGTHIDLRRNDLRRNSRRRLRSSGVVADLWCLVANCGDRSGTIYHQTHIESALEKKILTCWTLTCYPSTAKMVARWDKHELVDAEEALAVTSTFKVDATYGGLWKIFPLVLSAGLIYLIVLKLKFYYQNKNEKNVMKVYEMLVEEEL